MKRTYDHFSDIVVPEIEDFVNRLGQQKKDLVELHVVDEMHTIATTLLCRVGFDESSNTFQRSLFESTIWMVNDMLRRPANCAFPWLDKIPTPTNRMFVLLLLLLLCFTLEYYLTTSTSILPNRYAVGTSRHTLWCNHDFDT